MRYVLGAVVFTLTIHSAYADSTCTTTPTTDVVIGLDGNIHTKYTGGYVTKCVDDTPIYIAPEILQSNPSIPTNQQNRNYNAFGSEG